MANAYYILQLKDEPGTASLRQKSFRWLTRQGRYPDCTQYRVTYKAALPPVTGDMVILDSIYESFQDAEHIGCELTVGDIIALSRGGNVVFYYIDTCGYQVLQGFWKPQGK